MHCREDVSTPSLLQFAPLSYLTWRLHWQRRAPLALVILPLPPSLTQVSWQLAFFFFLFPNRAHPAVRFYSHVLDARSFFYIPHPLFMSLSPHESPHKSISLLSQGNPFSRFADKRGSMVYGSATYSCPSLRILPRKGLSHYTSPGLGLSCSSTLYSHELASRLASHSPSSLDFMY